MNAIDRLLTLAAENNEAGQRMQQHAHRFIEYKRRHLTGSAPRAITAFNLFQTPRPIAATMADLIRPHLHQGARILEPSAGLGRLAEPFDRPDIDELRLQWEAVEESSECLRAIRDGYKQLQRAKQADFLQVTAQDLGGKFDAVIMNPPFKQGRDIKHILHARDMLRNGGLLVALCYNGSRQNSKLKPIANTWEVLPQDSFKEEGTSASVAMLTIRK